MFVHHRLRAWIRRWMLAGGSRRVVASVATGLPAVVALFAFNGSVLYTAYAAAGLALIVGLVVAATLPRARLRDGLTREQRSAAARAIWLGASTNDPAVAAEILKRLDRRERSPGRLTETAAGGAIVAAYWAWLSYRHFQHHHRPAAVAALLIAAASAVQLATLPARRRVDAEQAMLARQAAQAVLAPQR